MHSLPSRLLRQTLLRPPCNIHDVQAIFASSADDTLWMHHVLTTPCRWAADGFSETQGRQPIAGSAAVTERKPNEKLSAESQCISGIISSSMQTIVDLPWLPLFPAPKHNRSLFICTCRLCSNALANPKLNASGFTVVVKLVPRGLEPRTLRLLAVRSNQLSYETIGYVPDRQTSIYMLTHIHIPTCTSSRIQCTLAADPCAAEFNIFEIPARAELPMGRTIITSMVVQCIYFP